MKKRTFAIAGSLAVLGFAAAPIAATAATTHSTPRLDRVERVSAARDRSIDRSGTSRVDRSVDLSRSLHDVQSPDPALHR